MKISFDFDNTLSRNKVQNVAMILKNQGHEIIIVTSRRTSGCGIKFDNTDLFVVAENLGIKDIIFTEGQDKVEFLKNKKVDIHIDDDRFELELLKGTKIKPIQVNGSFWIKKLFSETLQKYI